MASYIDELIEKVNADEDRPEGLLETLSKIRESVGPDATEEDVNEALKAMLLAKASSQKKESEKEGISEDDAQFMETCKNIVRELFKEEKWTYSEREVDETLYLFELGFNIRGCRLRMRVHIEGKPKVCRLDAILPITADSTYEYVLCKQIVASNYPKRYGALHYDERDGEMSYRYSFPIAHGLYKDTLKHLFLTVATAGATEHEGIKRYCVGKFKSKEINDILRNVNKLVSDLSDDE